MMRKIEKEEVWRNFFSWYFSKSFCVYILEYYLFFVFQEQVAYDDPEKKIYHLCIVNLVIGLVSQFYFTESIKIQSDCGRSIFLLNEFVWKFFVLFFVDIAVHLVPRFSVPTSDEITFSLLLIFAINVLSQRASCSFEDAQCWQKHWDSIWSQFWLA